MTTRALTFLLIVAPTLCAVNATVGLTLRVRAGTLAERDVDGLCVTSSPHAEREAYSQSLERFTFTEPHMGTTARIVLYAADDAAAKKAASAAFARIAELNKIMSDYDPDSELMRLCKAGRDHAVPVSVDLFRVLEEAEKYATLSDGAFDISIGPVVRLWRKARKTGVLPGAEAIREALERVDYRKIRLEPRGRMVRLLLVGMLLDLGGIAKGYAADAALAVLRERGITRALVALGGDIAVGEPPPGAAGWRVGIAPLRSAESPPRHHLVVQNVGISTAGDLHQAVEIDGKRYSHIIDPKTGIALVGRRSATVVAPNATMSDGLDTGMCVMGPERGMAMIEKLDGVAALYEYETEKGEEKLIASKRFGRYIDSQP
jgi:thiamine biosynthesis lipoprotein